MYKVFVCGGASYNSVITLKKFPRAVSQTIHSCNYLETIGNTGAGKAMALAYLNFKTTFHLLVGKDLYGQKVLSYLEHPNLTLEPYFDPKGTERHLNILNEDGGRISIFINPSSDIPNIDYLKMENDLKNSDFVVINISNYCRYFIPICKKLNKKLWTDLHDYDGKSDYYTEFIDGADYIFLSSENLKDYKSFMLERISKGTELVVCTHGKNGATAYSQNKEWIEVQIIDEYIFNNSNGAGDSFFSGFLFAFSKDYNIEKCMRYGCIAAGLCIESKFIFNDRLSDIIIQKEYEKYY